METEIAPVALVTGAGQGIGRIIAQRMARSGMDVALHYWDGDSVVQEMAAHIRNSGRRVVVLHGDLTEPGLPQSIVHETLEDLGRLDVVVNNAGVTFMSPFTALSSEDVDACYRINFLAPLGISQAAARWMIDQNRPGSIIHITSVHQERVTDRDNIYGAMKAALARLTESMAYELAPYHIRVNAVAPGRIATPEQLARARPERESQIAAAIPLGRTGTAEDVAAAVQWLSSEDSQYVTGITLRVDGGMNLPMTQAQVDGQSRFF